jgi:uncharacterized protein (DUF58 family)
MVRITLPVSFAPTPALQEEADDLALRLPQVMLEARRVSASLAQGLHGRRRAGTGENFWQFRPYTAQESAARIDWRRSARENRPYIREREWEASHNLYLWIDRSASMRFCSDLAQVAKSDRALVLGLALGQSLVESGEKTGLLGLMSPKASHRQIEAMAEALLGENELSSLPPAFTLREQDEALLFGDFLEPLPKIAACLGQLAAQGARGHVIVVRDPAEENFPFNGEVRLEDVETPILSLRIGDAASLKEMIRTRMEAHRDGLARLLQKLGWTLTLHTTDRPASETALKVLALVAGR